jgi:hypothetical protein
VAQRRKSIRPGAVRERDERIVVSAGHFGNVVRSTKWRLLEGLVPKVISANHSLTI